MDKGRPGSHRGAVCIGGACVDRKYLACSTLVPGTSNPAQTGRTFGGVARNVAENLARLSVPVALFSVVGDDETGSALLQHAARCGIDTRHVVRAAGLRTSEYAAVLQPDGELFLGVSDMSAAERIAVEDIAGGWSSIEDAGWLFVDCNVSAAVLRYCIERARGSAVRLAIDAVSESKVRRLPADLRGVDLLILNDGEAAAFLGEISDARPARERARALQERGAACAIVTLGSRGSVAAAQEITDLPAFPARCADATGAGDAFIAGTMYGLIAGHAFTDAARLGAACAALTLESRESVRSDLSAHLLEAQWTSA